MQEPIIEFINYYEFERVLREITEISQTHAMIIQQQADEMQKMKEAIEENKKKNDRIHHVVCDLVHGLFNDEQQTDVIQLYTDILSGNKEKPSDADLLESGRWSMGYWRNTPTTRQGDHNSKRIKSLEKLLCKIGNVFEEEEAEDY